MNVSITDSLEQFVQAQVGTGLYSSASEVVRAGLRLLREKEAQINEKLATSLKQIENGECYEVNDEFWEKVKSNISVRASNYKKNEI